MVQLLVTQGLDRELWRGYQPRCSSICAYHGVLRSVKHLDIRRITFHSRAMSRDEPIPVTSLRLPVDLKAELQQLADADQRTLSNLIIKILRDHVETRGKPKGRR